MADPIQDPSTDPTTQQQLQYQSNGGGLINQSALPPTGQAPPSGAGSAASTNTGGDSGTPPAGGAQPSGGLINQPSTPPAQGVNELPAGTEPNGNARVTPNPNLGTPPTYGTTVTPEMTTAGQIKNIIASGSPLMEQAEAHANELMAQRGLINSTMGITAAQSALYQAALPIAQQDAQTYYNADAAAKLAMNQGAIAALQSATTTAGYDSQQLIARISSDTSLKVADKQALSAQMIAALQANTSLSLQDKQDLTTMAKDLADNANTQAIAGIQRDTTLTVQGMQDETQKAISAANNANQVAIQNLVNAGNLANIQANGVINEKITQMTNDNKSLLQTSNSAQALYTQALTDLSNIMLNVNFNDAQKTTAMNNIISNLNDGLRVLSETVGLIPGLSTDMSFSVSTGNPSTPVNPPTPTQPNVPQNLPPSNIVDYSGQQASP